MYRLHQQILDGGGAVDVEVSLFCLGGAVTQNHDSGLGLLHHACVGLERGNVVQGIPVGDDQKAPALGVAGGGGVHGGPKQLGEHVLRDGTVRVAADAAPLKQFFQHSAVPP